ncbi:MAG: tetratricopeptide repeat-containing glycosyltransferase family 2 protein [Bacilli bacterium]
MSRLTLCMIVRDEADMIERCLGSVCEIVDEMIIVDTGSTDGTVALCESFGAAVFPFVWREDFSHARNAGLDKATGDWILVLDADDEISGNDRGRIRPLMDNGQANAYHFTTENWVGDAVNPSVLHYAQLRMFRNRPEFRYEGAIHERMPSVSRAGSHMVPIRVIHRGYLDDVVARKRKIERNMGILKQELEHSGNDPALLFYMGNELLRANRLREALPYFTQAAQALSLPPNAACWLPELPSKHAFCLWHTGDPQAALGVLEKALQKTPEYTDLRLQMGSILLEQRAFDQARQAFATCLEFGETPAHFPSQAGSGTFVPSFFLGMMRLEEGDIDVAASHFQHSMEMNPDYKPALAQLCLCHWLQRDYAAARQLLAEVEAAAADPAWIRFLSHLNEALRTTTMTADLCEERRLPDLLHSLAALAGFGQTAEVAQLVLQLPNRVMETVRQEAWSCERLAGFWLNAIRCLQEV